MSRMQDDLRKQIKTTVQEIIDKQKEAEELEKKLSDIQAYAENFILVPHDIEQEVEALKASSPKVLAKIENLQRKKEELEQKLIMAGDNVPEPPILTTLESKANYSAIFLGLLLVLLIVVMVALDISWVYPFAARPVVYTQLLDPNFHHLGDNVYSQSYIDSIVGDKIHNLASEGLSYVNTFDLLSIRQAARVSESIPISKVELVVFVNALKPRQSAPVVVGVNGQMVTYLNDFVKTEEFHRVEARLLLDVPLNKGQNEIEIVTGKDTEQTIAGFDEYEDFEFDHLSLVITFDTTRLNLWIFLGVIALELLILGGGFTLLLGALKKQP